MSTSRARSMEDIHPQKPMPSLDSGCNSTESGPLVDSATTPIEEPVVWPPRGFTDQSVLTYDEAVSLVSNGAVLFRGFSLPAHHTTNRHAHFHALLELSNGHRIREATSPTTIIADCMSFPLNEGLEEPAPCNTLEQPSMTLCFGRYPGTMSFGRYIGRMNRPVATIERPPEIMLRRIDLSQVLDRLQFLQATKDIPSAPDVEVEFLYGQLLFDPELDTSNGTLERDIDVLSSLLNSQIWVDFSDCKKQSVAKYDMEDSDDVSAELFFHQILLSMELDRRIDLCARNKGHSTGHLLSALPRRVAWAIAMSRRFFQNLVFEEVRTSIGSRYSLVPQNKFTQMEKILDVGYALKWPTIEQTEARMMVESEGRDFKCRWSMPSATFLSGTVLPGPAASWMVLSCLLDCNPTHRLILDGLKEMRTQSGFQYLSNTYWHWESIVGRVLGAMQDSNNVAGWIGPCISTPDLERIEYARIHQRRAPERMTKVDLRTIAARSEPLGTLIGFYPTNNFHLVLPNYSNIVDSFRVEKLVVVRVHGPPGSGDVDYVKHKVAVQFAAGGGSSSLIRLKYDVSFIAAAACWAGPHPLFYDYAYKQVRVDSLLRNVEWAGRSGEADNGECVPTDDPNEQDNDRVLVIEAYGTPDNAVLARAW